MNKKDYFTLFILSFLFYFIIALFQKEPGYMDAEFYFGQAIQINKGEGLSENFIWNYLNDPASIPVDGFTFWLPFTSFVASAGLFLFKTDSFLVGRVFFILFAACIPVITAYISSKLYPNNRSVWLAGILAMFSGYYLPYITITDTFTPYMLLGGGFFLLLVLNHHSQSTKFYYLWFLCIGIVSGLLSLTRSEGLLWLLIACVIVLIRDIGKSHEYKPKIIGLMLIVVGFAGIMTPWYIRNIHLFGSIFPPSNQAMFLLTRYEDIFVYPSNTIDFQKWLQSGFISIFRERFHALWLNLKTTLTSGANIILLPLIVLGMWKHRNNLAIKTSTLMFAAILFVMSFVFPFAGERGGFFHSISSLQIIFWASVPTGLDIILHWTVKKRGWNYKRAWRMFTPILILVILSLSIHNFYNKLTNGVEGNRAWNGSQCEYQSIEENLEKYGATRTDIAMVNDPPGYTLATNRQSVMMPSNGVDSILRVCEKFNVKFVLVNEERISEYEAFQEESIFSKNFIFAFEENGMRVYEYSPK